MNSRILNGGKCLQFGTGSPTPAFRHPYEKYGSRVSNDCYYRKCEQRRSGRGPDCSDLARKRSFKNGQDGRKNGRKGLEERNTLICQTFLTENPFFGAYYPAIRPRSAEGVSNRGSDRSRTLSTDFDDSKTYKIIYTGDSVCNKDHDSLQGKKLKKSDDIHHFHEHHHFFHDKNDESTNSTYYDKYQYTKAKDQTKSSVTDPNKSFLKQPIQESCMIYQVEENRNQHLDCREVKKEKSQEEQRHLSRSSSKSGKKSSDNETYTVVCEHCQKLLRDYPNARIVGHENIPKRFSGENYDKRIYVPHGYNCDSVPKTNWKPTNIFVAEPQHQVQRLNVSQESARWRKADRANAGTMGKQFTPFNVGSWTRKSRENILPKVPSHESSLSDSDSRSLIFKCDHCKSIIETKPRNRERLEETSSSSSSSEKGRGFNEKANKIKSASNENFPGRPHSKGSAATKRSNVVSERKSSSYKGLKGSRTLIKKLSSSQRVSTTVPSERLSKSYTLSERKKSSLQRTSRPSRVIDRRRSSGSRGSKDPNGIEKRSSSFSATRDSGFPNEVRTSRYKGRRASSEMSKRNDPTRIGLRERSASGKRINSAFKGSRDSNESKQKSSVYKGSSKGKKVDSSKTSKQSARLDKVSTYKKSITTDKKTCSTYTDLGDTCSAKTKSISNRKEKDSGVKRFEKTESSLKKVQPEKARLIQTEDRSMQTSSGKLMSMDKEYPEPKRSSTATKSLSKSATTKESKRSGTAPESLLGNSFVDPLSKSKTTRGSSTISRRTIASKDSPVIQLESTPEAKQSSRIMGIQTEITDLKSQLDRLEALHNMKTEAPDPGSNPVHEPIECPKHPIVVCTSTTYIMTKCGNDFGDRKSAAPTPRESEQISPKEKEPPQESSGAEEGSLSKCQRFCCSEVNPPHRVGAAPPEKTSKMRYCLGTESSPFKAGPSRASCQFVGARITRAINKVCHCPNRDFLSRYCDTPGRTRSCDRGDTCRRLFGNGKNQRRNWLRSGRLANYCNTRERKNVRCCTNCYNIAVPDIRNFPRRSYSDAVGASERLIAYQSYSTVHHDYELIIKGQDGGFRKDSSRYFRNDIEIDETSRPGYFLRTSISDVCEYRNGSLIRLIGRSGWIVYTKKLFLEGEGSRKNWPAEHPGNFDEFVIFSNSISTTDSKSVMNVKKISDASRESKSLIFLNERRMWSDSSFYGPVGLKAFQDENFQVEREISTSSAYLRGDVRLQNKGISNFHEVFGTRNNFPNELYLLDCKSAADRNATCADTGENGLRCTCRRRGREIRKVEAATGVKSKKEKVPVLFEEMMSQRDGSKAERKASDVSVKYVFAEKSRESERADKVIWSTEGNGSRIKKPCVFGVSKGKKNRRNREHFSMNDKQRKHRWHRSTSQKNKGNSHSTNKPEGDSPQNRCVCCNCSPNHVCSTACEREEEELTGIRKLLKDIGISGLALGFSRKAPNCRTVFSRQQNTEDEQNGSHNANYNEDFQTKKKEEEEVTEEVKEEIIKDEIGNSVTYLKKVSAEDRCCDCAKQLEQLLAQVELCKQQPLEPVSLKNENWEEEWNEGTKKDSAEFTKKEPLLNPDILDDISLQRRRITECENLLRQFEIQLEDVKRQKEAYACKCEESPRQEEPPKQEEQPKQEDQQRREEPQPASLSKTQGTNSKMVQNEEVGVKLLPECKLPIVKDDGYIRFEGKILTHLTNKRSTKSVGCGGANVEDTTLCSAGQTSRKTCMVKNATQMTSDISFMHREDQDSEHVIKEINFDVEELSTGFKKNNEDFVHRCCNMAQKIEVCCERTMCTCEKCCNIHFVDKHYLPANCFKKSNGRISENKTEAATYEPRSKKEIFTNTSERDEYTSYSNMFKSKKSEGISTASKPRKEDVVPVSHRPSRRDEGTSTAFKLKKDEGTSATYRAGKDEATSMVFRSKKDEATSTMCRTRKEEAAVSKAKREEVLSRKEIPRAKVENVPVKTAPKVMKEEEKPPTKDEIIETDRSRFRKESESVSEMETFVNQSDLEKTPSEEYNADECSSKDFSRTTFVKSKIREVICDCSQTSATEKCEDNAKCECASKGIQCAERRKMKRFCECGSKLKLIEDRLRALEERKKTSDSTISSPKERKQTMAESSTVSEKVPKTTSGSSINSVKEQEASSEVVSSVKGTQKETSQESSASYSKEKELSQEESNVTQAESASVSAEAERSETTESSSLTGKSSSLENIESETDVEIKTKVITCHNMNFFDGGDPNVKTKCQCLEDSFCPFKYFHNKQDLTSAKNIFFVTNIDLLRQWSGMYGCGEYSYCKNFWNVNESALKPVKLPRDWRNVKTAVASFFRSCKLRKKKFTFKHRKKSDGESSVNSAASRNNVTTDSEDSFLDDCSRSSMPLKRRSFHILAKSPRPTRPVKDRKKIASDKKRRKRSAAL